MKKYTRLFLYLVAIVSCILMIIYKQKYSNLSLVFQIMNTFKFKTPEAQCNEQLHSFQKKLKLDWFAEERIFGLPLWNEAFTGVYTYSAYWSFQKTRVLAFSKRIPLSTLEEMQCKLYYDKELHPREATIKISVLQKNKIFFLLLIECKSAFPDKLTHAPAGMKLSLQNQSSNITVSVMQKKLYRLPYTVCVKPFFSSIREIEKTVEFIAYHHHIGINHYILFDTGLSSTAKNILLGLASKAGIYITLLPWNVPTEYPSFFRNTDYLVECFHQVSNRNNDSEFLLTMSWNNFFVLKENIALNTLKNVIEPNYVVVKLKESKFCLEYPDDLVAQTLNISFVTLLKTKVLKNYNEVLPIMYNVKEMKKLMDADEFGILINKKSFRKTMVLQESSAVIHSYDSCSSFTDEIKVFNEDKYMWKYKDILFKSHLYQLYQDSIEVSAI